MLYPEYCCAILIKDNTQFLLQLRPAWSRHAPDKLVCFGGKREIDELPESCIRRELKEELNWAPAELTLAVQFWVEGNLKAWFYVGDFDVDLTDIQTEPGFKAHLIADDSLEEHPISGWHHAVLKAYLRGDVSVKL